jgi:ATP dependent DNA ligase-like protein
MSSMERLCCSEWMGSPISMVYIAASTMTKRSLYAFDILALGGDGLRKLPLHLRKTNLDRLLARRADGIHLAPFEQGEIGPDLFKAACNMTLAGLVSKRRDSRYRAGPSRDWIKVKNPKSPAMNRAKDPLKNPTRRAWGCTGRESRSVRRPTIAGFSDRGLFPAGIAFVGTSPLVSLIAFTVGSASRC